MTAAEAELVARPKLPIWRTVKAGYRDTFGNFGALVATAAVPFVLTVALEVALAQLADVPGAPIVRIVLGSCFIALFQLAWFRFLLLRGTARRPPWLSRPDRRLLPFCGYGLLLLLLLIPALLFSYTPKGDEGPKPIPTYVLITLLYVAAIYFNLRFAFVFPWIAVDGKGRLRESWRRTKRNGLRLLLTLFIVAVPLFVVLFIAGISMVLGFSDSLTDIETFRPGSLPQWVDLVVTQLLLFAFYGLSCAALAQAFCLLTGWVSDNRELLERFE